MIRIEEEGAKPVNYTVVEEMDMPLGVQRLLRENKEEKFEIAYECGDELYLLKGYGQQMTGGYSIQVNEMTASSTGMFVRTTLLGPKEKPQHSEPSFPYIVLKTKDLGLPVQFLEGSGAAQESDNKG